MKRVAVYGAAFNPPHRGHIDVINQISDQFDEIQLIPNAAHAFGKEMTSFEIRCDMLSLLISDDLSHMTNLTINTIEQDLLNSAPGKPVYTWDVLVALSNQLPTCSLTFIIGPDNADPTNWKRFYNYQEIDKHFSKMAVSQRLPWRSTTIRELLCREDFDHSCQEKVVEGTGHSLGTFLINKRHELYHK